MLRESLVDDDCIGVFICNKKKREWVEEKTVKSEKDKDWEEERTMEWDEHTKEKQMEAEQEGDECR